MIDEEEEDEEEEEELIDEEKGKEEKSKEEEVAACKEAVEREDLENVARKELEEDEDVVARAMTLLAERGGR